MDLLKLPQVLDVKANFLLNELFYLHLLNDGFKKFLITKNGLKPTKDDFGVTTMDLFEFLLDEESLNKE